MCVCKQILYIYEIHRYVTYYFVLHVQVFKYIQVFYINIL